MQEDLEFNDFVRGALESPGVFRVRPIASRRRSFWLWAVPSLLAASLALMAVFRTTVSPPTSRISDVIALLCLTEGVNIEGDSPADLLLAWQEAPYVAANGHGDVPGSSEGR